MGDEERSLFSALSRRDAQPEFSCFDILWSGGGDQRQRPLGERKLQLRGMWPHGTEHMLVADSVAAGEALFAEVCRRDLEGFAGKPLDSPQSATVVIARPRCQSGAFTIDPREGRNVEARHENNCCVHSCVPYGGGGDCGDNQYRLVRIDDPRQ